MSEPEDPGGFRPGPGRLRAGSSDGGPTVEPSTPRGPRPLAFATSALAGRRVPAGNDRADRGPTTQLEGLRPRNPRSHRPCAWNSRPTRCGSSTSRTERRAGLDPAPPRRALRAQEAYLDHLAKLLEAIGRGGQSVIVGRSANFLLPREDTLSVRIIAPLKARAPRLSERMGVSVRTARRAATELDRAPTSFRPHDAPRRFGRSPQLRPGARLQQPRTLHRRRGHRARHRGRSARAKPAATTLTSPKIELASTSTESDQTDPAA